MVKSWMLPSKLFLPTPSSNTSVGQSADCTVSLLFYPCSLTKLSFLEDHRKFYLEHSYVRPESGANFTSFSNSRRCESNLALCGQGCHRVRFLHYIGLVNIIGLMLM